MFYVYMALMQTPILVLKQEKFFVIKLGWPPFPADLAEGGTTKWFSFVQLKIFLFGTFKDAQKFYQFDAIISKFLSLIVEA